MEICHAQSCGKCVPCRVGLGQLKNLITDVLDGKATIRTLTEIHETAKSIMESADCAIGYEAANMVYKGAIGFKDDYVEHIMYHRCLSTLKAASAMCIQMSCESGYSGIYCVGA